MCETRTHHDRSCCAVVIMAPGSVSGLPRAHVFGRLNGTVGSGGPDGIHNVRSVLPGTHFLGTYSGTYSLVGVVLPSGRRLGRERLGARPDYGRQQDRSQVPPDQPSSFGFCRQTDGELEAMHSGRAPGGAPQAAQVALRPTGDAAHFDSGYPWGTWTGGGSRRWWLGAQAPDGVGWLGEAGNSCFDRAGDGNDRY